MDNPQIKAEFELDTNGQPEAIHYGDQKHYKIKLYINDLPEDTYAVTYKLHESYYDPSREARNIHNKCEENITSYGDYVVQARIRRRSRVDSIARTLSDALETTYEGNANPAIAQAIQDIREN